VPEVLAAKPALRLFQTDVDRICCFLVVRVLNVIPAAVRFHNASESIFIRWPGWKAASPPGLRRVPVLHTASMKASAA
jgi:hypothetical protein